MKHIRKQAEELLRAEDFEKALQLFMYLIRTNRFDQLALIDASECFYGMKEYHKAAHYAKRAYSIAGHDAYILFHYAEALYGLRQHRKSINLLQRIIKGRYSSPVITEEEDYEWHDEIQNDSRLLVAMNYRGLNMWNRSGRYLRSYLNRKGNDGTGYDEITIQAIEASIKNRERLL